MNVGHTCQLRTEKNHNGLLVQHPVDEFKDAVGYILTHKHPDKQLLAYFLEQALMLNHSLRAVEWHLALVIRIH